VKNDLRQVKAHIKSENRKVEILIVEDSPTHASRLEYILQNADFNVTTAVSGTDALACISSKKPSFVISDVIMPETDGY
jgi:PleD family two-component response regulator